MTITNPDYNGNIENCLLSTSSSVQNRCVNTRIIGGSSMPPFNLATSIHQSLENVCLNESNFVFILI